MFEEEDLTPTTLQEFVALCPQRVSKWLMTVMEDANKDLSSHWSHSNEDRKNQLQNYIIAMLIRLTPNASIASVTPMGKNIARKYLIRSTVNPSLVLCTDGEFHAEVQVGPGGWCAKIYKTERGATATGRGTVEEVR